jgi:hypothetical protein
VVASRSNEVKMKRKENYGKSVRSINSVDCVDVRLQSTMTYTYIGSRTYLLELDTTKSFLNKLNHKPYLESICSEKTGYSGIQNRTVQFLRP